jgi:hypothetical protein
MGGVDVRERIVKLADEIWRGLEATEELQQLLRENPGDPGPTEVAQLTDYLYRPEHVSRIAHSSVPDPRKRRKRRRVVAES